MPYPFVVPAGMIAVRVAGRWVLRKISDYLKQRRKEVKQRKEAEQREGASVTKNTAKPESSMKTKKKATRTREQLSELQRKLRRNRAELDNKLGRDYKESKMRPSPDDRRGGIKRAMIDEKGGLLRDVEEFKRTLDRQDLSTENIVRAYKRLRFIRLPAEYRRKEAGYIRRRFFESTDPTRRKIIRDDKRSVKEAYKKEVKENRITRKHQDSKINTRG